MGKWCLHASLFIFDRLIIEVAGNQDSHKSLGEFDFGLNQITHFGVTCPWGTEILHFSTWISLKPVGLSWSNFMCSVTGVGRRLHEVLGQIGSKLWFPWQQKAPIDLKLGKWCLHLFSVVFIWSFLYLQVTRTCIKSWTSLNFGQIRSLIMELAALRSKKFPIDL